MVRKSKAGQEVPKKWTQRKINSAKQHNGSDKTKQTLLADFYYIFLKKTDK